MTCVIAQEIGARKGIKRIEWRLLTNREADSLEAVAELIDWYRARWEIEILFNILKNGCRAEALQLGQIDKIELALAFYIMFDELRAAPCEATRAFHDRTSAITSPTRPRSAATAA